MVKKSLNKNPHLLEILRKTKRVVVKVGSSILLDKEDHLSQGVFSHLAKGIASLQKKKIHVILVSSGAIASGMQYLSLKRKPKKIEELQACAAIGQPILMRKYQKAFEKVGLQVAQILLTRSDLSDPPRFLNAKLSLNELLKRNIVPIINENDTVVVEEIRVGDNDNLAALVTRVVEADLLILLTDQEGFYTSDPRKNPSAQRIEVVENVNRKMLRQAEETSTATSVGGMRTKLEAAQKAAQFGIPTIIANGRNDSILQKIFSGQPVGTLFKIAS